MSPTATIEEQHTSLVPEAETSTNSPLDHSTGTSPTDDAVDYLTADLVDTSDNLMEQALTDEVEEIIEPAAPVHVPIERPPLSEDPRVQQLNTMLSDFERDEVGVASDLLRGAQTNLRNTRAEIADSGFISWASGHLDGLRETEAVEERLVGRRQNHLAEMREARNEAREQLQAAMRLEEQGRELEQQGDLEGAQELFNQAQQGFQQAAETLQVAAGENVDTRDIMRGYQNANATLQGAVENLQNTETGLRIARDTCVIVGATVATGGVAGAAVAAGYGTVAAGTIAVAAGTAAGTTIGAASNYTEAAGHIAHGNMTTEEALSRANNQTLRDVQTSAISSVAAATGTGAATSVTSRLGTSLTARTIAGAAAGGTGATTSTVLNTSVQYAEAVSEFNETYGHLPEAQQQQVYEQFMEQRGLTAEQIAWNSTINITTGVLSGGVGGRAGALRDASTGMRQAVAIEATELTTTAGIGLTMSYIRDGQLTTESVVTELQGAAVGFAQGRVSTQPHLSTNQRPAHGTPETGPTGTTQPTVDPTITPETGPAVDPTITPETGPAVDPTITPETGPAVSTETTPGSTPEVTGTTPQHEAGPHQVGGAEGTLRVSGNEQAVYVDNPALLREMYIEARQSELATQNPQRPQAEIEAQARQESEGVVSYFDPTRGQMVLTEADQSSRHSRIVRGSAAAHEHAHRNGATEAEAWRYQADYLNRNGYELDFSTGRPIIREAGPDGPRPTSQADIDSYIQRNYETNPNASIQPMSLPTYETQLQALPEGPARAQIESLISEGRYTEALEIANQQRIEAYERLENGADADFDAAILRADAFENLESALTADPRAHMPVAAPEAGPSHLGITQEQREAHIDNLHTRAAKELGREFIAQLDSATNMNDIRNSGHGVFANTSRFKQFDSSGTRSIWTLEVSGGERIIVGFDSSNGSREILFSGNPHNGDSSYKPGVTSRMNNYLRGS